MAVNPKHVNLRLSYELHHDLEFIAQVLGVSLNQLLADKLLDSVKDIFADPTFHLKIDAWVAKQTEAVEKAQAAVKAATA